jgi:hypothetical protein
LGIGSPTNMPQTLTGRRGPAPREHEDAAIVR